ncbi:hypothetical protein P154DRAFT_600486 [Amniculicola lignicola CBS 123094]|uniref:Uncharacterized protein n=1 Tax=Amniculicola lignicola CBS 123094 TaxID=1392246 RepID=A0A6A5WXV2_9PLEO|nr:hypothetical protein P154DRAFT_600486 [Amniculicola lignicola CBS 123094]
MNLNTLSNLNIPKPSFSPGSTLPSIHRPSVLRMGSNTPATGEAKPSSSPGSLTSSLGGVLPSKAKAKNFIWNALMSYFNLRFGVFALSLPILLFYTLLLTGCLASAPGLNGIFLAELQHPATDPIHELRVGYFGVCYRSKDTSFKCFPTTGLGVEALSHRFNQNIGTSKIGQHTYYQAFASTAYFLQHRNFGYMLAVGGILYTFSLIFLIVLLFKKRRFHKSLTKITAFTSSAIALACCVSSYHTVRTMKHVTELGGEQLGMEVSTGLAVQILQWVLFVCSVLFGLGVGFVFTVGAGATKGRKIP